MEDSSRGPFAFRDSYFCVTHLLSLDNSVAPQGHKIVGNEKVITNCDCKREKVSRVISR